MHRRLLERLLARATGESVATIRSRGFSLFDPANEPLDFDEIERNPNVIDWDSLENERIALACQA